MPGPNGAHVDVRYSQMDYAGSRYYYYETHDGQFLAAGLDTR